MNSLTFSKQTRTYQDGEPTGEWSIIDESGRVVGHITSRFTDNVHGMMGKWTTHWTVESYEVNITDAALRARIVGSEPWMDRMLKDGETAVTVLAEVKRWVRTRVFAPAAAPAPAAEPAAAPAPAAEPAAAPAPAAEIIWTADGDVTIGSRPDGAEVGIIGSPRINAEGVGFRAVTTAGKDSLVRDFRTLDEARAWIATFA